MDIPAFKYNIEIWSFMKKIAKKALYNKRLLYKLFGFSMLILFLIFQPFDLLSNINTGIKRNVIITLIWSPPSVTNIE